MPRQLLHVVQISFFSDPEERSPAQLLEAWPTLVDVAEAAAPIRHSRLGRPSELAFGASVRRDGVQLLLPAVRRRTARDPRRMQMFGELLRSLAPDVFHVHGLGFPRDVLSLVSLLPGVPIILQDHANKPPRFWRRALWRRGMSVAAAITFCALAQARPFADAGLVPPGNAAV